MDIKITDRRKFSRVRPMSVREVFGDWPADLVDEVEARVEKGMAWLDEHKPDWFEKFRELHQTQSTEAAKWARDWWAQFDLTNLTWPEQLGVIERFNISEGHNCILGITYGDYDEALNEHDMSYSESVPLGFMVDRDELSDDGTPSDGVNWGHLQRMWTYKVEKELGITHYASII